MRSNEVFARMSPEDAQRFLQELRADSPSTAQVALAAASNAYKLRPQFLRKQPLARQAEWMRKALGRKTMAAAAEEVLAEYFLERHNDLLVELLDALGVEHENGQLKQADPPCPEPAALDAALTRFRAGDVPERRELLLAAFCGQSAIDWPDLESRLVRAGAGSDSGL